MVVVEAKAKPSKVTESFNYLFLRFLLPELLPFCLRIITESYMSSRSLCLKGD